MNPFRQLYERLSEERKDEVFENLYKMMLMRSSGLLSRIHPVPQIVAIAEIFHKELGIEIEEYT